MWSSFGTVAVSGSQAQVWLMTRTSCHKEHSSLDVMLSQPHCTFSFVQCSLLFRSCLDEGFMASDLLVIAVDGSNPSEC